MLFSFLSHVFLTALPLDGENAVQRGGRDPQPFRDGDVVFHGLVHGPAADYKHMGTAQKIACHVDAVFMLLRYLVIQKQRLAIAITLAIRYHLQK